MQTRFPVQLAFAKGECCIHDSGTVLKISLYFRWNSAKANCTGNRVYTFCDIVVLGLIIFLNESYQKSQF